MPGAAELEDAWLRARLGEGTDPATAYLTGKDAEVAACDALTVPVVTGHADMTVIDKIIALAAAGPLHCLPRRGRPTATRSPASPSTSCPAPAGWPPRCAPGCSSTPSAHRRSPWTSATPTPSPGTSAAPSSCATSTARGPAAATGPPQRPTCITSGTRATAARHRCRTCGLFCEFHHETCIHRWGWQVTLHPDGTMEARSPDGRLVLRNHAPPNQRAA